MAEAIGDKNFDLTLWQGFFAPKATPKPIVDRLHTEISRILASPDMQLRLRDAGADVRMMSVAQFADFTRAGERQVSPDHQGLRRQAAVASAPVWKPRRMAQE